MPFPHHCRLEAKKFDNPFPETKVSRQSKKAAAVPSTYLSISAQRRAQTTDARSTGLIDTRIVVTWSIRRGRLRGRSVSMFQISNTPKENHACPLTDIISHFNLHFLQSIRRLHIFLLSISLVAMFRSYVFAQRTWVRVRFRATWVMAYVRLLKGKNSIDLSTIRKIQVRKGMRRRGLAEPPNQHD